MRLEYGFGLSFPYYTTNEDGTVELNRAMMHSNDPVDTRRIKRILRKWVKVNLGRTLHTKELLVLMRLVIRHKTPRIYVRALTKTDAETAARGERVHHQQEAER